MKRTNTLNKLILFLRYKSKYTYIYIFLLLWIVFFDAQSFYSHVKLIFSIKNSKKELIFYQNEIKEMHDSLLELQSDTEQLERYAREKYYMKKKSEDLYVIK